MDMFLTRRFLSVPTAVSQNLALLRLTAYELCIESDDYIS